jgi:hypothetical protein
MEIRIDEIDTQNLKDATNAIMSLSDAGSNSAVSIGISIRLYIPTRMRLRSTGT